MVLMMIAFALTGAQPDRNAVAPPAIARTGCARFVPMQYAGDAPRSLRAPPPPRRDPVRRAPCFRLAVA